MIRVLRPHRVPPAAPALERPMFPSALWLLQVASDLLRQSHFFKGWGITHTVFSYQLTEIGGKATCPIKRGHDFPHPSGMLPRIQAHRPFQRVCKVLAG